MSLASRLRIQPQRSASARRLSSFMRHSPAISQALEAQNPMLKMQQFCDMRLLPAGCGNSPPGPVIVGGDASIRRAGSACEGGAGDAALQNATDSDDEGCCS